MRNQANADELPYLSDILEIDEFRKGQANIIVAPCHSGKTTAAKEIHITHKAQSYNGLVLIDTTAGRDSLLIREKAQRTPAEIAETLNPYTQAASARTDTYVTMTYYQFGIYARNCPDELDRFDVIICDEMHNLIRYLAIEEARNKKEDPDGILRPLTKSKDRSQRSIFLQKWQESQKLEAKKRGRKKGGVRNVEREAGKTAADGSGDTGADDTGRSFAEKDRCSSGFQLHP